MPGFISGLFRFVLKLVLGAFALVFAVSLLLAALVVLALSLLKSLITGRKPAPSMVFGRFQKFAPQGMWPGGPGAAPQDARGHGEIVDVEVREVREVRDVRDARDDTRLP